MHTCAQVCTRKCTVLHTCARVDIQVWTFVHDCAHMCTIVHTYVRTRVCTIEQTYICAHWCSNVLRPTRSNLRHKRRYPPVAIYDTSAATDPLQETTQPPTGSVNCKLQGYEPHGTAVCDFHLDLRISSEDLSGSLARGPTPCLAPD